MSKVYFNLAAGNLTQDWSNTGLITADDNWANVPSFEGFLGQNITTTDGVNPACRSCRAPTSWWCQGGPGRHRPGRRRSGRGGARHGRSFSTAMACDQLSIGFQIFL